MVLAMINSLKRVKETEDHLHVHVDSQSYVHSVLLRLPEFCTGATVEASESDPTRLDYNIQSRGCQVIVNKY